MEQSRIELDEKHWLRVRRNDDLGGVFELWRLEYSNPQGGSSITFLGRLFTFYDADVHVEGSVPHWSATLYYVDPVPEQLARRIAEVLLTHTACKAPVGFGGCPIAPYDEKKWFFLEFGKVFMDDD
jgi:hypothetical protein